MAIGSPLNSASSSSWNSPKPWTSGDHIPACDWLAVVSQTSEGDPRTAECPSAGSQLTVICFLGEILTSGSALRCRFEEATGLPVETGTGNKPENKRELRADVRALDCEWVVRADLASYREPVTGGYVVSRGADQIEQSPAWPFRFGPLGW
jgi:hypothetical protein